MKAQTKYMQPTANVVLFSKDEVETSDPYFTSGARGVKEGTGQTEFSQNSIEIAGNDEEPD